MRPFLFLSVVAFTLASCQPPGQETNPTLEQNEFTVQALISAWASADTSLISEIFWPEATYDDFPNQTTYEGLQEIVAYITGVHEWGDDIYMNAGLVHVSESGAVAEWTFSAVQRRPMGDLVLEGTGREVVLNGVTILEIVDGRILRAADYMDTAPLMLQLGARIELPGGAVLEWDAGGN
jgi:hypothetical protein